MPLCIERSNDLAPLPPFPSWLDCTTNTSGYDFRKDRWSEFDIINGTRGSVSYGETEAPLARTSCKTLNPSNSG